MTPEPEAPPMWMPTTAGVTFLTICCTRVCMARSSATEAGDFLARAGGNCVSFVVSGSEARARQHRPSIQERARVISTLRKQSGFKGESVAGVTMERNTAGRGFPIQYKRRGRAGVTENEEVTKN